MRYQPEAALEVIQSCILTVARTDLDKNFFSSFSLENSLSLPIVWCLTFRVQYGMVAFPKVRFHSDEWRRRSAKSPLKILSQLSSAADGLGLTCSFFTSSETLYIMPMYYRVLHMVLHIWYLTEFQITWKNIFVIVRNKCAQISLSYSKVSTRNSFRTNWRCTNS